MKCFLFSLLAFSLSFALSESFVAPAEPQGSVLVKLYPTETVAAGSPQLVTFGVPFTRGSIASVTTVRVIKGTTEIPAFVDAQTPWRHCYNNTVNGQSVRVARIQINYTFIRTFPECETLMVQWGGESRSQNIGLYVNPRTAWHQVTSGSFVASDSVWEPNVYAVLPKETMCKGVLKPTRMLPWEAPISETRDKASWLDTHIVNIKLPSYGGFDYAQKNLTFSYMGKDSTGTGDYMAIRTDYSAWLYDRPATIFLGYFRGGGFSYLREAVRNADYYQRRIYRTGTASGAFIPKVPTPTAYIGGNGAMYSYLEGIEYTHWLTGDDAVIDMVPLVVGLYDRENEPTRWSPTGAWGQERHTAFEMLANVCAFELTGETRYKTNALRIMGDYIWHQNGASGKIDSILGPARAAKKVDGGLYHFGFQHASDWEDDSLGASPWMSVLVIDAVMRLYPMEESDSLKHFFRRYGSFLARVMTTYVDVDHGGVSWILDPYVVRYDGSPTVDMDPWSDPAHSPEIGASIAWGNYFADILGQPDPLLDRRADTFYEATLGQFASSNIRPGSTPEYYVRSPSRLLGWQLRPSCSWSWLGHQSGGLVAQEKPSLKDQAIALTIAPNPTNPITFIHFNVPSIGKVRLQVYDANGRLVATLKDELLQLGSYQQEWNASDRASGVYYVQIQWNEKVAVQKTVVVR